MQYNDKCFKKQVGHIANIPIHHQKSFSHRDQNLLAVIESGVGNVVAFSDGGFWESGGVGRRLTIFVNLVGRAGCRLTREIVYF